MSDQHLRPGPGEPHLPRGDVAAVSEGPTNPWEQRAEIGWRKALWLASKLFLVKPVEGYDGTQRRGGFRGPLLFALVVCFVAAFMAELFDALYQLAIDPEGSGNLGDILDLKVDGERVDGLRWLPGSLIGIAGIGGCIVGLVIGVPVFALMLPLVMLAWTGILHLCLRLVGGLRSSEAGYQGTWAAVCYATVALIPGVVPVIGDLLSFLWLGLLQGIGFWRLHRTTPIRATVALLLPFTIPATLWLLKWLGWFPIEPGGGP